MSTTRREPLVGLLLQLLAAMLVVAYVVAISPVPGAETATWTRWSIPTDGSLVLVDLAVAALLIGCATASCVGLRQVPDGVLFAVLAVLWLLPILASRPGTPPPVLAASAGSAPLLLAVLLALVMTATARVRPAPRRRLGIAAVGGLAVVLAVLRIATYNPFLEADCQAMCPDVDPFLAVGPEGRTVLRTVVAGFDLVVALAIAAAAARVLVEGRSAPGRAIAAGGLVVGGVGAVGMAALAGFGDSLPGTGADAPIRFAAQVVIVAIDAGMLLLAIGLAAHVWTSATRRLRVRRVAEAIAAGPSPAEIEEALRSVLADPTVEVGYWVDEAVGFARSDGTPFVAASGPRRSMTVVRDGDPIACIGHDVRIDGSIVTREVRPSMLIALDNERLRTASVVRLADLRRSRRRIVELGDTERRRLERDLHDGAQQRLMAISFGLRLARLDAERAGDAAEADRVAGLEKVSAEAVDELRRVARGIHPAILSEVGLGEALESLAEESPIPVTIIARLADPPSTESQVAAYHLVREAIADAAARRASEVRVEVAADHSVLHIGVTDTGSARADVPVRVADRASAAGGDVLVRPAAGVSGLSFEARLPCA